MTPDGDDLKLSTHLEASLPILLESWGGRGHRKELTTGSCGVTTLRKKRKRQVSDGGREKKVRESGEQNSAVAGSVLSVFILTH